ncbi:hypothetical protein RND81_06G074600 [Saponaria officinalis]|uniref:Uncharacterized protein n=1 Tax=Saponaria officinalis TaxID=3572 RepID=A0AAW1K8K8_SAPOF
MYLILLVMYCVVSACLAVIMEFEEDGCIVALVDVLRYVHTDVQPLL